MERQEHEQSLPIGVESGLRIVTYSEDGVTIRHSSMNASRFVVTIFLLSVAACGNEALDPALTDLLELANAGDAAAQFELACIYQEGSEIVPKDDSKAAAWFRRSAEHGGITGPDSEQMVHVANHMSHLISQMMIMAAGVFAIAGGILGASQRCFKKVTFFKFALVLFALSACVGYFLQGRIITALFEDNFNPNDFSSFGLVQFFLFVMGSLLLSYFLVLNLKASLLGESHEGGK